jgi:solute carrier family 30 (zinc transporter), member 2
MNKENRLIYAIILSGIFMVVELIGGWLANSIAIYSDAAHLLTDVAGFLIALVAVTVAKSPATKVLTYGSARAEVFGAILSLFSLWIITAVLLWAAYGRATAWFEGHPDKIDG